MTETPREEESPSSPRQRFSTLPAWVGPSTRLLHAARRPERNAGAVVPPIYQTSTFHFPTAHSESAAGSGLYLYTRYENPTQEVASELVRSLEGAESARVFGSGMGAIASTLFALLRPGEEVVALESLYGGTIQLLTELLPRFGVRVRWVGDSEARAPEELLSSSTKVVFLESPTNPTLRVHDLRRWAKAADAVGAVSVVDNTFATPINQRPLSLGIDLVVHSGTKYLGGHSDLVAGVVAGPRRLVDRIASTQILLGSVLDPFAAFLLSRGLRTLALRVERQNATGSYLARQLAGHPNVLRVCYPGSASKEEAELVARQMDGRGGMVAFTVAGGAPAARRFLAELKLVHVAASLGGVESLVSLPIETSHVHLSPEERARRGIEEGMVRLSVGIEEPEDLWRDLKEALDTLGSAAAPPLYLANRPTFSAPL